MKKTTTRQNIKSKDTKKNKVKKKKKKQIRMIGDEISSKTQDLH